MAVAPRRLERAARVNASVRDDDVRGRVLNAAVKLIDKGGLAGLSMREVARAAGVSHQAPYHYFADREAIFAALAKEGFEILTLRLENSIESTDPAVDRFCRAGQTYVEFALDHPALFRIMFRPDLVAMERFPDANACGKRAFQTLPTLVQACIAEGLPAEPNVEALVVLAWSIPHGLACLILDGPLARTVPESTSAREQITSNVMAAMRAMLVARMAQGRGSTRTRRTTATPERATKKRASPAAPRRS
jgi:AcrR family transcriptional regulator